ncbi:hypothetical protein BK708_14210 [Bacillus thuringiensis serovar yunnanensis]|nr:hypothetical protein BK708_14210 [Bacillus thuringiensis serovar yunnanensis]
MKKYKKLAVVMPLASLLTTGIGVLERPSSSFADTIPQKKLIQMQTTYLMTDQQAKDQAKQEVAQVNKDLSSLVGYSVDHASFQLISTNANTIELTSAEATGDSNIELGNYHNGTDLIQDYKVPGKKETNTSSATITNNEDASIGFESDTEFEIGIPLFAKGKETLKFTTNFKYSHGDSRTSTTTEEVTYPEQVLKCSPHGTTKLVSKVQKTNFTGKYSGKALITGVKDADGKSLNSEELFTLYTLNLAVDAAAHFGDPNYEGMKIPDSLEVDWQNHKIYAKSITTTFQGVAGHSSDANVEFIPDDKANQSVTMALSEYNRRIAAGISLYTK